MTEEYAHPAVVLVLSPDSIAAQRRCAELSVAGYRAIQTDDIGEALTAVRGRDPRVILLLPPLGGVGDLDVPAILREVEPLLYIPLLVELPSDDEALRCEYLDRGADDVIGPRTSGEEMIARCRSLIRARRTHDQLAASRAALQESLRRERKLLAKLRKDNANLQELCTTDPLTHAQNVRSFRDILAHEFRMAVRYAQPLSLLTMDVDHFKLVNDVHGHPSGDYVLKELAVVLQRSVRASDVVARTGGEEFSIVLPKADLRRCAVMAARVRREAALHEFTAYGHDIRVTISIGTASYPADAEIVDPLIMVYLADQALLVAKETGRDRVTALHELEPSTRQRLRRQYRKMHPEELPCDLPVESAAPGLLSST